MHVAQVGVSVRKGRSAREGLRPAGRNVDKVLGARWLGGLLAVFLVLGLAGSALPAEDRFEGWDLEPSLRQAHLVMVVRVARVSKLTVIEGAKTDVPVREFRFHPVEVLKGIFQRDELAMTASDLGLSTEETLGAPPLEEGQFRLLILAQQQGLTSYGCVAAAPGAATFQQRVPRLADPADPLVAVVKTLIRVAESRSRQQRALWLMEHLEQAAGVSTVPLLNSFRSRADWASQRVFDHLARLAQDPHPAIREAAVQVIRAVLTEGIGPSDAQQSGQVSDAIREVLVSNESRTSVRLAALEALTQLLQLEFEIPWALPWLVRQATEGATNVERVAAVAALGYIDHPDATASVLSALARLPLDSDAATKSVYARAATKRDAQGAERILLDRLARSLAARQSIDAEVAALVGLGSRDIIPLLVSAADEATLASADQWRIAHALGQLGEEQGVPILVRWMRSSDHRLKEASLSALEAMASQIAAREAWPLLKTEAHLPYKLRLARLLARQGIPDGFALAMENLSDTSQTAAAALVLAALQDHGHWKLRSGPAQDLHAMVEGQPDGRWNAAALAGLVALGDPAVQEPLLEILADDRHPLITQAAQAVGLSLGPEFLPHLAELARSRNKQIAAASLTALQRYLSGVRWSPHGLAAGHRTAGPGSVMPDTPAADLAQETRTAIAEAVSSLAADAYVDSDIRSSALVVARLLGGAWYNDLLSELADQAELEGTSLLAAVQSQRRQVNLPVNHP